jgi:hypothetical protein
MSAEALSLFELRRLAMCGGALSELLLRALAADLISEGCDETPIRH